MTLTDLWPAIETSVTRIANEYGGKFRQYGAERDDFLQEAWCWLLKNEDLVLRQYEELEEERFDRWLSRCIRNEAIDYGVDIKAQALGYERRDLYFYSEKELESLLDAMFDREAWLHPPQLSEGRSSKTKAEGNNWVATLADVSKAFDSLGQSDQGLLRDFHANGFSNRELAEVHGVPDGTMSSRHTAAIRRLQRELGGPAPKPMASGESDPVWRGRHSVPNATALAMTRANYEEE